jgi:hypothetical protein
MISNGKNTNSAATPEARKSNDQAYGKLHRIRRRTSRPRLVGHAGLQITPGESNAERIEYGTLVASRDGRCSSRYRTISRKDSLMAEINLTQTEADALIAMEKHRVNDERWDYPVLGGSISVPLISADRRENFILDVSRGRINFAKGTYQNRSAGCRTRSLGLWRSTASESRRRRT